MSKEQNLIGKRFGKLLVLEKAYSKNGVYWVCQCDCGQTKVTKTSRLNSGKAVSCGCLLRESRERFRKERFIHGKSKHELFTVWVDMRRRCRDIKNKSYKDYGARGIKVCARWENSFSAFLEDMGERPCGKLTIERKDNNLGYNPLNCVWASRMEQNRNSKFSKIWTINGRVYSSSSEAAKGEGVCRPTIYAWCGISRSHGLPPIAKPGCFAELKYRGVK